jgi:hypothetical protein
MMTKERKPVLPYAASVSRPSRFRLLRAILPFSGGAFVGLLVAGCIVAYRPDPALMEPTIELCALVTCGVAAAWFYVATALFLVACFSRRQLLSRPWPVTATLGLLLPLFPTVAGLLVHVLCNLTRSGRTVENDGLAAVAILTGVIALATPVLMVQWGPAAISPGRVERRALRPSAAVIGALVLLIALVWTWRWSEGVTLDRDCGNLAAWVKASYPAPGSHPGLILPARFRSLSADGTVDAVVLPDAGSCCCRRPR